jgi:hypothetical protein
LKGTSKLPNSLLDIGYYFPSIPNSLFVIHYSSASAFSLASNHLSLPPMFPNYDVIVGVPATPDVSAVAAANIDRVLLATMNMQTIAQMSCNPAMGGVAKGR